MQCLESLLCFGPLWERAGEAEAEIAAAVRGRPGRRKQYHTAALLAVDCARRQCGSARAVTRELADPVNWRRIRRAVAAAWPDRPERRLGAEPISRSQYHRGRDRYLDGDDGGHKTWTEATAARAARQMGMLAGGSRTRPAVSDVVYGDGTWINAMFNADPRTAAGAGRRCDPDAVAYHKNRQSGVGRQWVITQARNDGRPGERVPLAISPQQPHHSTDADTFAEDITRLHREIPGFAEGAVGACYDGALHAKPRTVLHDLGIVPVAKTRRNAPTARLGPHKIKLPDGTETHAGVFAVDGTPAIAVDGGRGCYLKLRRDRTFIRPNRAAPAPSTTTGASPAPPPRGTSLAEPSRCATTPPTQTNTSNSPKP